MTAHGLVERAARPAIGLHAKFLLHFLDCRDGDRTDAAIGIADIVAAGDEQALQLAPLAYGYVHDPFWQVPGDEKHPLGGELQVTFAQGSVTHAPLTQPKAQNSVWLVYLHTPPMHVPGTS